MALPHITFRSAKDTDLKFLRALRLATMREVVRRHKPWRESEQDERVLAHLDCARIIQAEGRDIGLLKVVRKLDEVELLQIQLLPEYQGRGIGTEVIESLKNERLPIVLGVYASNRALNLYSRLGFKIVERLEHSYTMRWQKEGANQALERNAYVRHAACGARVAPATGVAHL